MKSNISSKQAYFKISLFILLNIILLGCVSTSYKPTEDTRTWAGLEYEEELTINTEPQGSKIYLDGTKIGISPLTVNLGAGEFHVLQKGTYNKIYTTDQLGRTIDYLYLDLLPDSLFGGQDIQGILQQIGHHL